MYTNVCCDFKFFTERSHLLSLIETTRGNACSYAGQLYTVRVLCYLCTTAEIFDNREQKNSFP